MADHTLQGELKAVGKISLKALAGIQPGETRDMEIPVGVAYVHLPYLDDEGVPGEVGVDVVHVTVRRPA